MSWTWRELWSIELDAERYREVLRKVPAEKDPVSSAKNIANQVMVQINRLEAYSVSEVIKPWKKALFEWLQKLLKLAQELKVSFVLFNS